MRLAGHDAKPPSSWPNGVIYLAKARLDSTFPSVLIPLLSSSGSTKFSPTSITHPSSLEIKPIVTNNHPAKGQYGLFAKRKIAPGELIIPYLGIIHATLIPSDPSSAPTPEEGFYGDEKSSHEESDYDLSLLSLSSADPQNPYSPEFHVLIGVDAAKAGNAARFVNDYRGIGPSPNAEFRLGRGASGELRMEIWSLGKGAGIPKGEEILVSYGKGWWSARRDS